MNRRRVLTALSAGVLGAGCTRVKPVLVGSKDGAEPGLLGEILAQLIEGRVKGGAARRLGMGRTPALHQAMMMSEIDVYPEYTGAAHIEVLKAAHSSDPSIVFERVKLDYRDQYQMDWLAPLGFNASFVVVGPAADPRFQGIATISDLAGLKTALRLAAAPSFITRSDGNANLVKEYDLPVKLYAQTSEASPPLYRALAERRVDIVVGTASDGALLDSRWKVLTDDKGAFLPNQACLVARADAFRRHPDLRAALNLLSGKIPQDVIRSMNRNVDSGRGSAAVASDFLVAAGLA
jgi:glycine betaine/choline ABC-type transport system substrate-binding protein